MTYKGAHAQRATSASLVSSRQTERNRYRVQHSFEKTLALQAASHLAQHRQTSFDSQKNSSVYTRNDFPKSFLTIFLPRAPSGSSTKQLSVPVFSLATVNGDGSTNMNVVTYASPVGIEPERLWMVSLYKVANRRTRREIRGKLTTEATQA